MPEEVFYSRALPVKEVQKILNGESELTLVERIAAPGYMHEFKISVEVTKDNFYTGYLKSWGSADPNPVELRFKLDGNQDEKLLDDKILGLDFSGYKFTPGTYESKSRPGI